MQLIEREPLGVVLAWDQLWFLSKKNIYMAVSSTKGEYIVANVASKESIWIQKFLVYLYGHGLDVKVIFCDN